MFSSCLLFCFALPYPLDIFKFFLCLESTYFHALKLQPLQCTTLQKVPSLKQQNMVQFQHHIISCIIVKSFSSFSPSSLPFFIFNKKMRETDRKLNILIIPCYTTPHLYCNNGLAPMTGLSLSIASITQHWTLYSARHYLFINASLLVCL